MDLKQLRDIVKRKDGEQFCQFFRQLAPEEVLELSEDEYQEIMSLAQQMGKQKIVKDNSFFCSILEKAILYLKTATSGREVLQSTRRSLFCNKIFLNLYPYIDKNFASALVNNGISLSILAEQGVNPTSNLNKAIKCYNEAGFIFNSEGAIVDYAETLAKKGECLGMLGKHGVEVEKNIGSAIKLFQEAKHVLDEEKSLLCMRLTMSSIYEITELWLKFQKTKKKIYLEHAIDLHKKTLKLASNITHPVKKSIIQLLSIINDIIIDIQIASDRTKYNEILKKLDDIKRDTERIPYLHVKIGLILSSIEKSTHYIIDIIKIGGEKVSEEVARDFTRLADDLRELSDKQQKKLLEELCRLLTDPIFQKKLLRESPPEKKGSIKSIFQRIKKTAKGVAGHMPSALAARQNLCYFDWLWVEVLHLTPLHPALVLNIVISPFIAFKDRLSKS